MPNDDDENKIVSIFGKGKELPPRPVTHPTQKQNTLPRSVRVALSIFVGLSAIGAGSAISFLILNELIKQNEIENTARKAFETAVTIPEGSPDVRIGHFHANLYGTGEYGEVKITHYDFQASESVRISPNNKRELYHEIYPGAVKSKFDIATDKEAQAVLDQACINASNLADLDPKYDDIIITTGYLAPYFQDSQFTSEYMRLMGQRFKTDNCPS